MQDRILDQGSLSLKTSLSRVSAIQRRIVLRYYLTALVDRSPVSRSAVKIGTLDIDKNLFSYLKTQAINSKPSAATLSHLVESLWILKERKISANSVLEKKIVNFLSEKGRGLNVLNLEVYLKVKRLELLLRRITNNKAQRDVSAVMNRFIEEVNKKNKHKALNFLIKGVIERKELSAADSGLRAIFQSSKQKKVVNYEFHKLDSFFQNKHTDNIEKTITGLAVFGHMRSLYSKKYRQRQNDEESQIEQMMGEYVRKPRLYIPIIVKDRELKRIILFFKVLNDVLCNNQRHKYNPAFFKALLKNKESQINAVSFAKRIDKIMKYAVLKQLHHIFIFLKYNRVQQANPRSAFMLLKILFQNRKKYHFNQFYYLATFKRRGMRPNISTTKSLSFKKKPKAYNSKLFDLLENYQFKKLKSAFLLIKMTQRKLKKAKKNLKVVYGKINTLKMPKMNMQLQSNRASMIRGGSQDFDNQSYNPRKLIRSLYGQFHWPTYLPRPSNRSFHSRDDV